jgi:hypothetical protein
MKNVAGKTRPASNPYAEWTDLRSGWEYKLLKSWQGDNSKPYARWFVDVKGFGHDMGDEYVSNINPTSRGTGLTFDTTVWPTYDDFFRWCNGLS